MKQCFKCSELLPLAEFYKHPEMTDGYLGKCKSCAKSDAKKLRDENLEKHRANDRRRYYEQPDRRAQARRSYANWDPVAKKASLKKWGDANRHKKKAHALVGYAIKSGKLTRPDSCEKCDSPPAHAHHADYTKPLDVVWLCAPCHGLAHRMGA